MSSSLDRIRDTLRDTWVQSVHDTLSETWIHDASEDLCLPLPARLETAPIPPGEALALLETLLEGDGPYHPSRGSGEAEATLAKSFVRPEAPRPLEPPAPEPPAPEPPAPAPKPKARPASGRIRRSSSQVTRRGRAKTPLKRPAAPHRLSARSKTAPRIAPAPPSRLPTARLSSSELDQLPATPLRRPKARATRPRRGPSERLRRVASSPRVRGTRRRAQS